MPEPQPIPVLARIQPYKPAAKHPNPRAALAANENPHGASPHAIHAAQQELQRAQCYPAGGAPDLVQALAKQFNLKHKQLICGAGSDELIYMINLAYAGEKEAVLHPQYGFAMYRLSALTARAEPIAVKLDKNDRLSIQSGLRLHRRRVLPIS
ncbi:MAG: aminotransferase class I/II-fold pyridoxal phosphate-dependent enzyme [Alphaproteobacteria bacterium]